MAVHDFSAQRLYVTTQLQADHQVTLDAGQSHYISNVLRMRPGDEILLFDGMNGEWRAVVTTVKKREVALQLKDQVRAQQSGPDIDYLFAPLKRARLDYMVQKAVELGVRRLSPVFTHRTVADRVNIERMKANAVEAAEQCGVLHLPEVATPRKLGEALGDWDIKRPLIFCDEAGEVCDPISALRAIEKGPIGLIIGPEGGFDKDERQRLLAMPCTTAISLGPRIMRADTAAVAALSLVNATVGDWCAQKPQVTP
ncbi:MAG: 16S rRNA (uracil(1498)-N(3))-methyltransferase [Hyphomicrobiaceae bacterium]